MKKLFTMAMIGILSLASFALDLTGVPEAKTGMFRQIKGSSMVITNGTEIVEALTNVLAQAKEPNTVRTTWSHPYDWRIWWEPTTEEDTIIDTHTTTNDYGMVYTVDAIELIHASGAKLFYDYLDQVNLPIRFLDHFEIFEGDATLSGDTLHATTNQIVGVRAVATDGTVRETHVPLYRFSSTSSNTTYTADSNANRNAIYDEWFAILNNAELVTTNSVTGDCPAQEYEIWRTIPYVHAWQNTQMTGYAYRGGNVWPWAVSPHVMATADHYTWSHWWSGNQTLPNKVSGGTFTIHKSAPWVNLRQWAINAGFDEEEVKANVSGDIALIYIDQGEIPSECCPYFTDQETLDELFGTMRGIPGWTTTQEPSGYAVPCVFTSAGSKSNLDTAMYTFTYNYVRSDILEWIGLHKPNFWNICGGDSGRSFYIRWKGQDTIMGTYFTAISGPNYPKAFKYLKAFVESKGDTLKVMSK